MCIYHDIFFQFKHHGENKTAENSGGVASPGLSDWRVFVYFVKEWQREEKEKGRSKSIKELGNDKTCETDKVVIWWYLHSPTISLHVDEPVLDQRGAYTHERHSFTWRNALATS